MDRRRYLRAVALAGGTVGVAGCTDGGEETETPTEESTMTPDEPTDEPTEEPTDESTAATSTPEPPTDPDRRVAVGDGLAFDPDAFEISVGDTVLWEWVGAGHNIKYDDGAVPADTDWTGTEGSRTTTYGEGHAHWHTFEAAGEYAYYCVPHQSNEMRGQFTVVE